MWWSLYRTLFLLLLDPKLTCSRSIAISPMLRLVIIPTLFLYTPCRERIYRENCEDLHDANSVTKTFGDSLLKYIVEDMDVGMMPTSGR
jgi:hypothetical protein